MQWNDFTFDIESYPNVFAAVFIDASTETTWIFEVSDRVNQSRQLLSFLRAMASNPNNRMVGFNNVGYDYPVLHSLMGFQEFTAADAYARSMQIIQTDWNDRHSNIVWESDRHIRQVDLFKIHHFDNRARMTSLKQIEIALRLDYVADLPYPPGTVLTDAQIPDLLGYNVHDVRATLAFYRHSLKALEFRDEMSAALGEDVTNQSDTNIGSKVFITELEAASPGICGRPGRWRQTPRHSIALADCIFPYVSFKHPAFQTVLDKLRATTIRHTNGVFDDLTADCYGMTFAFGTGGIHGAVENRTWCATPDRAIQGRDVKSYYPNLAIANRVFPEHLSDVFCDVYQRLYQRRQALPKSDMRNGALKLALNGTYGNSNSQYSPFYDPKYTMTITINGQLLLCMLAEALAAIPTLELIQVNTDGVEYAVDRQYLPECDRVSAEWESLTGLELEADEFALFAQRDCNSYVAVSPEGKVKLKGAYDYLSGLETGDNWHKNQGCKVIARAAEACIVHGVPVRETVTACDDPFDFMHTLKVQRGDRVMLGGALEDYEDTTSTQDARGRHPTRKRHTGGVEQQRTGRFYASRDGQQLWKIMKPLAKLPHHERPQAILKDVPVTMCNDLHDFEWSRLDRDFYSNEAQKLVDATGNSG